jgi:hypothetical protein
MSHFAAPINPRNLHPVQSSPLLYWVGCLLRGFYSLAVGWATKVAHPTVMIALLLAFVAPVHAVDTTAPIAETPPSKIAAPTDDEATKKWWKEREKRSDVYYPHKAHFEVMEKEGDSCLLCHPYNKTDLKNVEQLKTVTLIANEALKPVCHSCHVEEKRGPWRCTLCHTDKEKIWPADHRSDYANHHGEKARQDEAACQTCHLDTNFCTDCHLRRDTAGQGYHPLAYRTLHGLEARMDAGRCGRCHNEVYCSDCHATR